MVDSGVTCGIQAEVGNPGGWMTPTRSSSIRILQIQCTSLVSKHSSNYLKDKNTYATKLVSEP